MSTTTTETPKTTIALELQRIDELKTSIIDHLTGLNISVSDSTLNAIEQSITSISGTTPNYTDAEVTIPPGYLANQLVIPLGLSARFGYVNESGDIQTIDLSTDTPVSSDTVDITDVYVFDTAAEEPFYDGLKDVTATADNMLKGVKALTVNGWVIGTIETVTPTLSADTFTCEVGYVSERYSNTVAAASIVETATEVTISEGYFKGTKTYKLYVEPTPLPTVNVTSEVLREGFTAIDSSGNEVVGNLKTVSPVYSEASFSIASGYLDTEISIDIINSDDVVIEDGSVVIPSGLIVDGISKNIPMAEIVEGDDFIEIGVGYITEPIRKEFSNVEFGYVNSGGEYQAVDITQSAPADVGDPVAADYSMYATGKSEPTYEVPVDIVYGYINADGKFQQIDVESETIQTVGDAIDVADEDITMYSTNAKEPDYISLLDKEW